MDGYELTLSPVIATESTLRALFLLTEAVLLETASLAVYTPDAETGVFFDEETLRAAYEAQCAGEPMLFMVMPPEIVRQALQDDDEEQGDGASGEGEGEDDDEDDDGCGCGHDHHDRGHGVHDAHEHGEHGHAHGGHGHGHGHGHDHHHQHGHGDDECGHDHEHAHEHGEHGHTHGAELSDERMLALRIKMMQRLEQLTVARRAFIQAHYDMVHPALHTFNAEYFLCEPVVAALRAASPSEALLKLFERRTESGVYTVPLFRREVCDQLIDEVEAFELSGLPVVRPNSMNHYGAVMDELGFGPMLDALMEAVVLPVAAVLFPTQGGGSLDTHHGFVVQYRMQEDRELSLHVDDSEVTLNVCLGRAFTGGNLVFRGRADDASTHDEDIELPHAVGVAALHIGRHRHAAKPLTSGERFNLILWCRSSSFRHGAGASASTGVASSSGANAAHS